MSQKMKTRGRGGYVFPLILLATLAVGVFVATVGHMQISHKKHFSHLNEYQHSFNIAYSALVELLADVKRSRWSGRSFKNKPVAYTRNLFGGTFNLMVENHATEDLVFNVKIRVVYKNKPSLYYWRLKYEPSLLDFDALVIPQYFSQFEDSTTPGYTESLDEVVNQAMKDVADNKSKIQEIFKEIKSQTTPGKILEALGAVDKNSGREVAGADVLRPPEKKIVLAPEDEPAKKITEVINETKGADTPAVEKLIANLPLKDIYPDKIDVNIGLSRKEIVLFFVRILQLPEVTSEPAIEAFSDISDDSIFNRALGAARQTDPHLVRGYPDGRFGPDDFILRGHMAKLLEYSQYIVNNRLADPDLPSVQRSRYQIINSFASAKIPEYRDENPYLAMTVGDGLGAFIELLDNINEVQ